jgi:hypothetical protein
MQTSCSEDVLSNTPIIEPPKMEVIEGALGKVEYFNKDLVSDGYVLINNALTNQAFLMDKNADLIHEWPLNGNRLGNDVFLMNNGQVLAMLESDDPKIEIGGFGGKMQLINVDGSVAYNFEYATDNYILHHDAEMLPNGNIITQVWERKTMEEAQIVGSVLNVDVFPDAIIEIDPATSDIVWEWHAWDHLIQDHDSSKESFGVISDNPQKINLNFVPDEKGDIMHANGITYDASNDVIFLSVNAYSEVWVIDHSTTTQEATSALGGNYSNGGDLVYRFGNPMAYNNTHGERLFFNNHFPNLLSGNANGNILIFSNGQDKEQSTVYELKLPNTYSLQVNQDNEPDVVWSFTDPELYSAKVSGAVRLPNGNTMITEGDFGVWEVTSNKEVIWKFSTPGFFWRAYHYDKTSEAVLNLNL